MAIEIQNRFYEKINWRMEPISMDIFDCDSIIDNQPYYYKRRIEKRAIVKDRSCYKR